MAHGVLEHAVRVRELSRGGTQRTTSGIEHVYGTFRERLASLTRTHRHAAARVRSLHTGMDLHGCTSTCCIAHQERSREEHWGTACTPAMASGLTDPLWTGGALLSDNVAPALWVETDTTGATIAGRSLASRPLCHLRKGVFCSLTVEGGSPVSLPFPL